MLDPKKPLLFLSGLLAACSSAPDSGPDRAIEQAQLEKARKDQETLAAQKQDEFQKTLLNLDKLLDDYVKARWNAGNQKADNMAASIESAIRDMTTRHYDQVLRTATQTEFPENRSIALAALGFAKQPKDALDALRNGLRDPSNRVVASAVLGLGELRDPKTPPQWLADVFMNKGLPIELRRSAASELVRLQTALFDTEGLMRIWSELLDTTVSELDSGLAVQGLTGLGLLRKPDQMEKAARYLSHPEPLVRMSAAIALGRLGNAGAVEPLLTLLGNAESNQNVRLAVRKALQALAGDIDCGYDVPEWRKAFQRKKT